MWKIPWMVTKPAAQSLQDTAVPPDASLPKVMAHPPWRHPEARHTILLQGQPIAYALQWAQRRSVGLRVSTKGLEVRAPRTAGLHGVEAVLHEKAAWVVRKMHEQVALGEAQNAVRIDWGPRAVLPYLGGAVQLQAADGHCPPGLHALSSADLQALSLCVAPDAAPERWKASAWAWWQARAQAHFRERLEHFAPLLNVRWTRLRLLHARTRWGTAHADGRIALNPRLLHCPPDVLDYVVVHELAHLQVMDHSPRFWAVVSSVTSDHVRLRRALHACVIPPWE